ncbi:ArnT family glycosyltransferase [Leifsonia sp. SIMBA_070]|uniref:ArnT family glycosyltransferase n=1 Tax=Leifsonia sp. SIMBA_070 TaxID=3085810 RepID=UPI00397AC51E
MTTTAPTTTIPVDAPRAQAIRFLDRLSVRWVALALVFLWGAYQSLWSIATATPNADEPQYVLVGRLYLHGDLAANHEQPPTAKYLFGAIQLVFGEGPLAPRLLVGALTVIGGVIVFLWLRPELGWLPALVPTAFWLLLPRGIAASTEFRLDRFAVLDPVMVFFAIAAMAAAWQWHRGRSVVWIGVAAVCLGLSATSKPTTAVMIPAFLVLILLRRKAKEVLIALAVAAVALAATVLLVYWPIGIVMGLRDLIEFQAAQNATGHLIDLGSVATAHPPWWANFYFAWKGFGRLTVAVFVIGGFAALFDRRNRVLVVYLLLALAPLMIFYLFIAKNALPSYYYAWSWALCLLAGIGCVWLLRPRASRGLTVVLRTVGVSVLALALAAALHTSALVWNDGPTGFGRVDQTLRSAGIDQGMVLVSGVAPWEPDESIHGRWTTDPTARCIVAVATKQSARSPIAPDVAAFIEAHRAQLRQTMLDAVTFYSFDQAAAEANCR